MTVMSQLSTVDDAEEAFGRWADGSGGAARAEAARWGALYHRWPFAFDSARAALASDAPADTKRALSTERIAWADEDPSRGDPLALRAERAALFPGDAAFVEEWIRALEKAGRLDEAEAALRAAKGLPEETRLLVLSDLLARTLFSPNEISIGAVTALLGAPAFLVLLRRRA